MRATIAFEGSDDYGDCLTVRVYFDDESWIEVDATDYWDLNRPRDEARPYGQGATVTRHNADGTEDVVFDGCVMPAWFAKRQVANQKGSAV